MTWLKRITFLLLILVYFYLIFKFVRNTPYFYIALSTCLLLIGLSLRIKRSPNLKAVVFNLAFLALAFALSEAYLAGWLSVAAAPSGKQAAWMEGTYTQRESYFTPDEIRGYTGAKNVKVTSKLYHGHELIYDVTYTTNRYGLRVSPHDLDNKKNLPIKNHQDVAFFGCSYMVGEGVKDNETVAYLLEEKSQGKYLTYNFGFHGYGPHQMLRVLETGLLDRVIQDKGPLLVIYWALTLHIERAAGNYPYFVWDAQGPKYKLNSSGEVEYAGRFKDDSIIKLFIPVLNKSRVIDRSQIIPKIWGWPRNQQDIELVVKIITKSKEIVADKYHGDFYVLLWSEKDNPDYDFMLAELKRNRVKVITTEEILGPYEEAITKYLLKGEGHPNQKANEKIADYLLKYLRPRG
jgi:hypothetical protein